MSVSVKATSNTVAESPRVQKEQALGLQDQFMNILLAQLRYQDPMEPMNERDFFAQMAQFTTATQVSDLNENVKNAMTVLVEGQADLASRLENLTTGVADIVEQLRRASAGQTAASMSGLIGREVGATTPDGDFTGTVNSVVIDNGQIFLRCGEHVIPASSVTWVGGNPDAD